MTTSHSAPQHPASAASRIQWVDAMRGFSMIVVVLAHVLFAMGFVGYDTFLNTVLQTFRMPLFFLVSGFFAYRAISWWNARRVGDMLKRKVQAQVICAIVCAALVQYIHFHNVSIERGFVGVWFTIVLFQMYIIYLALSLFSRLIRRNIVIPCMLIISAAFLCILVFKRGDGWAWNYFVWENLTKYMQFFTVGIICSKYRDRFFALLSKNVFITIAVVGWVVCMVLWYNEAFHSAFPFTYSFIHDILVRYLALATVIIMFFGGKEYFSSDQSRCSRWLNFIGRRTLDIYMIHTFLIPNLAWSHAWFATGNMLVLQLAFSGAVTAVVVALCLLISQILRKSDTLAAWLFGVKPRPVPARS